MALRVDFVTFILRLRDQILKIYFTEIRVFNRMRLSEQTALDTTMFCFIKILSEASFLD